MEDLQVDKLLMALLIVMCLGTEVEQAQTTQSIGMAERHIAAQPERKAMLGKGDYVKWVLETPNMLKVQSEEKRIEKNYEKICQEIQSEIEDLDKQDTKEWFMGYKEILSKYNEPFGSLKSVYEYYNDYEIQLIWRVIETECYQADFDSKCNVASVVLNRIYDIEKDGRFGTSIKEIITSPRQFAYGRENISEDTILALEYAFMIGDTTQGCIAFHSNNKIPTFNGWSYVFTDNIGHHFYKQKGE